ncbi:MAG TPA: hypothetical protein VM818_00840 [Vicinamibacterales bacterium]|nr:hypothetical protein [Vicinamibacterales bacterium]
MIETSAEEVARSHRWHAVQCNNAAWSLSELAARTAHQDAEMLDAAHAAAFHWSKVGSELQVIRAKMLLGHVHASLGHGELALRYATESYDSLAAQQTPDWELALAHAVLAHAAFAAAARDLQREHYAVARALGQAIADPEDKQIFFNTFNRIPGP